MRTYNFTMRIDGSARGTVKANTKKEAEDRIRAGEWDDIDIDVEDIFEIESVIAQKEVR